MIGAITTLCEEEVKEVTKKKKKVGRHYNEQGIMSVGLAPAPQRRPIVVLSSLYKQIYDPKPSYPHKINSNHASC